MSLMRRRTRRLFFYALVAVFILVGGYLALAAGGWVFSFKTWRIEKTGALFLKFSPSDARIYLDGALQNASAGFLSSGVFIPNLAPDTYHVRVAETGYASWNKDLTVESGFVTSASQVELWPEAWDIQPAATGTVPDFWLTGSGAVVKTQTGSLRLDGDTIAGESLVLSDPSNDAAITTNGRDYSWVNLNEPKNAVDVTALFDSLRRSQLDLTGSVPIERIFFHPFSATRLLIVSQKAVYLLDLRQPKLSLLLRTPGIVAAATSDNEVFTLDSSSTLDIFNLLLQTESAIPLGVSGAARIVVTPEGGNVFILQNNGTLTGYKRGSQATTTLASGVADFWISPGEERMALKTTSGRLRLLALKNFWNDGNFTAGETWDVAVPGGQPDDFSWVPDFPGYGLTLSGGELAFVELDPRSPGNASVIANGVSKFYLNGSDLFFLKSGVLESVDLSNL